MWRQRHTSMEDAAKKQKTACEDGERGQSYAVTN